MDTAAYFIVLGISIVSARHTLNVDRYLVQSQIDPNHSFNTYSGRDIDSSSNVNLNQGAYSDAPVRVEQPVYSDQRQLNVDYVTQSDHVALISEKVQTSNIGNDVTVFKLRTNAYPTRIENTDYTTESITEHKHREQTNTQEQNVRNHHGEIELSANEGFRELNNQRSDLSAHADNFPKNQRSFKMGTENRFIPHEKQSSERHGETSNSNVRYHNVMHTNAGNIAQNVTVENRNHVSETVTTVAAVVRPTKESSTRQSSSKIPPGSRDAEDSGRVPKGKDDEEIPWVWGTEPGSKVNTTEIDDLDDRAAFDGSMCPSGYVKVMGVCVEKH